MTIETIIKQYDFNLEYARVNVADLDAAQMVTIPATGLDNHPAFTLGHLVSGSADLARDLGAGFEMPAGWAELFVRTGPGDPRKPGTDPNKYPGKAVLVAELERQHDKVKAILRSMEPGALEKRLPWRFGNFMPLLGDVVTFMCITHEAMHLGQLAAWRRAMGLPSALAAITHLEKPYH